MPRGYNADGSPIGKKLLERQPEDRRTEVMPDEKLCRGCDQTKPWHQFGLNVGRPDGLASRCFACERAYQARWRDKKSKEAAVQTARERTARSLTSQRDDIVIEEPPQPTPLAGLFQMFATQTTEQSDEVALRYQLAAQMLANQQEILKLLLGRDAV